MSSSRLTPFAFDEYMVRTLTDDQGNLWFIAKDVALALEYQWNGAAAIQHVPEEWKMVRSVLTTFGSKDTWLLSEQGLYFFLGRSDKPKALPFQKWLAGEVLPALRRTGTYAMPSAAPEPPAVPAPEPARKHALPDIELPEEALHLRPAVRLRLWQDSLQAARLEGAGMTYAVECFIKLCTVMGKMPPVRESPFRREITRFIHERCHQTPGARTGADALYQAFRAWRQGWSKDPLPSKKVFGETMGCFFPKLKSNGVWYRNVSLLAPR